MKEAAKKQGCQYEITATSLANLKEVQQQADLILLAPQVRFDKERVEKAVKDVPVDIVDMVAYGMMDGEKVLNQAKKLLKDE
jgi:PTS system cellobiose-specific IIB component